MKLTTQIQNEWTKSDGTDRRKRQSIITVGDFNILISIKGRGGRKKFSKVIENL